MKSERKKISVIIPIYNVEKYIDDCMKSIINQSYQNMEIILIDDGSTDNSGYICDEYANKDNRIVVIHQINGGAASAKNAGLRRATGEYLTFVDSDDWIEADSFSYMVKTLEENNADIIQCAYRDVYVDRQEEKLPAKMYEEYDVKTYLRRYTTDWTCCLLWDKIYKRELFEGIFFEEGHIVDDEFFTYQGVMNAKKIVRTSKVIYNYRKRKSSVTAKPDYKERIIFDKLEYLQQRRTKISNRFPELKKDFDMHYLNMLSWMVEDAGTESAIQEIQKKIGLYFEEQDYSKVGFRQRWRLHLLQKESATKLLEEKVQKEKKDDLENYFD